MKQFLLKFLSLVILIGVFITPVSNANYLDTETSVENNFTAACWTAPTVPTLLSPADNIQTNATDITLDWSDSAFVCPDQIVEYQFEWNGSESVWQEASQATFSVSEGTYIWRARARDSQGYISDYSAPWTITIDQTPPVTTLSFNNKSINEKVLNGGFESGLANWQTAGEVNVVTADTFATPYDGTKMAKVGHTSDTGNEIWENKLTQQIPSGAKNISFYYNFFSYDFSEDDPGMIVRLNDYNVFYLSAKDIFDAGSPHTSGWTQVSFDISQIPDPVLEIIFYSGNTDDEILQSWVYIDNISTAEAVATDVTDFILTPDETAQTYYSFTGILPFTLGNSFNLSTVSDSTNIYYYSVDNAGNSEGISVRRLVKDSDGPAAIDDLIAAGTSKQTINLSWSVPADATVYDIRYSEEPITDGNFLSAAPVPNPPAPVKIGESQSFEISGLDSATYYYLAIKSADAALNWSDLATADAITLEEVIEDPDIRPGDVVINELMWMGTSGSTADEYLELRNMTDIDINLSNWVITNAGFGGDLVLPDLIIPAKGYFLITNFNPNDPQSRLNDSLVPNWITTSLTLHSADTQYILKNSVEEIDVADNNDGIPAAGQYASGANIYYSMERDAMPGNGYDANVWHTCLADSSQLSAYWDSGFAEKGTPGGPNLSQAAFTPPPLTTELSLSYASHSASFVVTHVADFRELKYIVTYDSDSGPQGISGTKEINGEDKIEIKDLITGTCSSGGTCTYHQNIKLINLEIVLSGSIERTLTKTLAL